MDAGEAIELSVQASGNPEVSYQWMKDGSDISGATSATFSISSSEAGDNGEYLVVVSNAVRSVNSNEVTVIVRPTAPAWLSAEALSDSSIGLSWDAAAGAEEYHIQHSLDGSDFSDAGTTTGTGMTICPLSEGTEYTFRVIAVNGSAQSDPGATDTATTWSEPVITTQPEDQDLIEGDDLQLSVVADGNPAVSYQWYKNDQPIGSETERTFSRTDITTAHAGRYYAVITNSAGSVPSKEVTVTVQAVHTLSTTVHPVSSGTISTDPDQAEYVEGTMVQLTAHPVSGYRFDSWSGDVSGTSVSASVTMDEDKSVTADFIRQYKLTVTAGEGGSAEPDGDTTVDADALVNIHAIADDGFVFDSWEITSGSSNATIVDDATIRLNSGNATVKANFRGVTFAKQVQIPGYSDLTYADVVQTEDGGYLLVSGELLVKIDVNGDYDWHKTLSLSANSIQPDGTGYIIAGTEDNGNGSNVKTSQIRSDGTEIGYFYWGGGEEYYQGRIAAKTSDNGYIVVGGLYNDLLLYKLTESNTVSWDHDFTGNTYLGSDVQETSDGYVVVGAVGQGFGSFLLKTDTNGDRVWETSVAKYVSPGDLSSICLAANGDYVMSGRGYIDGELVGYLAVMPPNDTTQMELYYYNNYYFGSVERMDNGDFIVSGAKKVGDNNNSFIGTIDGTGSMTSEFIYGNPNGGWARSMKLTRDGGAIAVGDNNWVAKVNVNENREIE